MTALASIMNLINLINRILGNVFMWLSVGIVVVCFWVVVERYIFGTTRLWMQDLYPWMNGVMFTAVAGYALYRNDHVRVDIYFRPASALRKAWLDLLGVLIFLLPFSYIVWTSSFIFVQRSIGLLEGSSNPGGMPGLFVLKSFILVFAVVVGIQGISMAIRSVLVIAGREDLIPPEYNYDLYNSEQI
ncbi:TRAP transporter small permease subunit [Yoonia sp.]|uniref:TRAP transporter small permease subunit n=1 Tax=Yoonia sp. TaxID=2212373 RepID=UPI00391CBE0B